MGEKLVLNRQAAGEIAAVLSANVEKPHKGSVKNEIYLLERFRTRDFHYK